MRSKEGDGYKTAMRRTENYRKPGVRILSNERVMNHFRDLQEKMTASVLTEVWMAVRRALCEGLVILGDESEYSPRGYRDLKRDVTKLLS